jgi:hypothetical protein
MAASATRAAVTAPPTFITAVAAFPTRIAIAS